MQHRENRLNKYLAKFQARLRVADRDTARIEAVCDGKSGDIRAEWEEFLSLHIDSVARFKEELADYARMRDETVRMKKDLDTSRPQSSTENLRIEKQISALLGTLSMRLEQVVINFADWVRASQDYELALKELEHSE